uniref:Uncharacterized protein n=1 Tax=Ciona savignyi TaxID=51511 RepID=H2YVN8_CIOSA
FNRFLFFYLILLFLSAFTFNEYFIYYFTIFNCRWPKVVKVDFNRDSYQRLLVLSDPHLLGDVEGHWFDKLRREWQMYMSFQSAVNWFRPDGVFILGDLLDEGKWANEEQWDRYVANAKQLFNTPSGVQLHVCRWKP